MASNYPASLDSFDTIAADKKTSDTVGGRTHRAMHNDLGDAIEAVQAELGVNPSGSAATVVARLDAAEAGIGNLLTANQASIETDTTGWLVGSGTATLSRSTSFQMDGSACLRAAVTADGTILVYSTPDTTVAPGETYTAEAWFRVGTADRTCYPYISWRDSGGSSLSISSGPATMCMQGEWTRIQVTGTAPANAATARQFLRVNSPVNGDYIYFDRMGLWKGAGGQWQPPGVPIIGLEDGNAKVGNLLTRYQASLESGDISGWVSSTGSPTLTRSTSQYLHGSASLRIEATADATILVYASPNVQVRPGQNYTLTASFRPTSTRDCYPYVSWYDSSGASLGTAAPTAVSCTGSTWTTVQHTGTAPATAVEGRFFLRVGSAVTGDYIYVDKVGFWRGAGGVWSLPGTPVVGQSHIATNGAFQTSGTVAPEGVITAPPLSRYLQTSGAATATGAMEWVKAYGTDNTGWVAGAEADTGHRNISASVVNGQVNDCRLRRYGNLVELTFGVSGYTNAAVAYTLPNGFRPSAGWMNFVAGTATVQTHVVARSGSGEVLFYGAGGSFTGFITFLTSDLWPSSLPGSAA